MTLHENYKALARYNRWMNERLYAACEKLSDAERKADRGAFFKSVHITLNHLLWADRAWLRRFGADRAVYESLGADAKLVVARGYDTVLYEDFADLKTQRAKTDADLIAWVDALTERRLAADLVYKTSKGDEYRHALWWALSHLFNHQTHHRGQITTLLSQQGVDVGDTDLVIMLRG